MKRYIIILGILFLSQVNAQNIESVKTKDKNTAEKMIENNDEKLTIGGYGQIDYNQPLNNEIRRNGKLDVHRLVILFGYKFNDRTQFITEIEYEHVKEVFIEQAFLNYRINNGLNFRGGLLLIPMGIINEYHEPTTFNGVERPSVDGKIAPTTWREIGAGITGNLNKLSLKYQAYLVNGFNGYDEEGNFNGSKGLRSGRQKGAESYISSPNFTGKIEYYGINGLSLGLSGYFGNSQSQLYDGINKADNNATLMADSSVVGINMIGMDAKYSVNGFQARGQYYYTSLKNTIEYNELTGGDLGKSMTGYYVELGYNVFQHKTSSENELIPFVRFEKYDTHLTVENTIADNPAYDITEIVTGLGWKIAKGAMLKADMQFIKSKTENTYNKQFNAGIAIWF